MPRKVLALGVLIGVLALPVAAHGEARTFSSPSPIVVGDVIPATPYPDTVQVSGMSGVVSKVTAAISGFTHPSAYDVDILLVSPSGRDTILMGSRCNVLLNANFTFDDFALGRIPPQGNTCPDGTYKPADSDIRNSSLPSPAPALPYGQTLSELNGTNPDGTWKLFVDDASIGGAGAIAGGWSLSLETAPAANVPATHKCKKGKRRVKKSGKCVRKHRRHRR